MIINRSKCSDWRLIDECELRDAQRLDPAVDTLVGSTPVIESVVERAGAIQGDELDTAEFPVAIPDTAFAFRKLFVLARLARFFGEEQGTVETLSRVAVGVVKLLCQMRGQTDGAEQCAIRQTSKGSFGQLSQGVAAIPA